MSDETNDPKPAPAPTGVIEAPLTSWVRGGTSSSVHEAALKKKRHEAELRRAEEATRQQTVAKDPVGAHSKNLIGGKGQEAAVVLEFRNSDGKAEEWIKCELKTGAEPNELIVVMCCPRCARRHGMDESQFHFSNKHKRFDLDTRRQGDLWVNPLDARDFCTIAGTIFLHEVVSCPTCAWRFKIDNSVVKTL